MVEKKKKKPFAWFWEEEGGKGRQSGRDPWEELERMHRKLWEELWHAPHRALQAEIPVSLSEKDGKLILRAEFPGFKKEEVGLRVTEDGIELAAEKKREEVEKGETFYRREAERRAVHRSFALPVKVDPEKVEAKLEEGILTVTMEKKEKVPAKKKAVEIK
jgi:HSP20 family protein